MHTFARALERVASRYAPSRLLSFDAVHVFVALQLMHRRGRVSRQLLEKELALGGGATKTLVKHLKMGGLVETSNGGTRMTARGRSIFEGLAKSMPAEMPLPRSSSIAIGRYNYAVVLKGLGFAVRSGIEQRDAAIRMGGTGATTLLYRDGGFAMPLDISGRDPLSGEPEMRRELDECLAPEEGDVVIIGAADGSVKAAELAAKGAALATLMAHEKHS
jgi:hypothetical protein